MKVKSSLTNLIAFYDEMAVSVDERVTGTVYLKQDFQQAFHSIVRVKPKRCELHG